MNKITAPSEEVQRIIDEKIGPALEGEKTDHVLIALTVVLVEIIRPDLEGNELIDVVAETSKVIALYLNQSNGPVH